MLRELMPALVQAGREVIQDVGIEWVRHQLRTTLVVSPEPAERAPGCPYCQITRHLAAAYRYLRRAGERAPLASLYAELAAHQVADARGVLIDHPLSPSAPSAVGQRVRDLERALRELGTTLDLPVDPAALAPLADAVWRTSDLAMDLAEWHNAGTVPD